MEIEVPSVRSTVAPTRGCAREDACEVSLVALLSRGGLRFLGVLSIVTNHDEKENAVPRDRRLCRPCSAPRTLRRIGAEEGSAVCARGRN